MFCNNYSALLSSSFAFGHGHNQEFCHTYNNDKVLDGYTEHQLNSEHNTEIYHSTENCILSDVNDCEFALYLTTDNLNIRSLPSTESKILDGFLKGENVHVCAIDDGWATIDYCGMIAYVSAEYIQKADSIPSHHLEEDDWDGTYDGQYHE